MRAFIGITDRDWFELLRAQRQLDEVNFWQPGGQRVFGALEPGELFLFKLHSPRNFIVGGGVFAHATLLPVSLAWSCFGIGNGAADLTQMRGRIEKHRRAPASHAEDYTVGCILLEQPFFLDEAEWIPVPADFAPQIVKARATTSPSNPGSASFARSQSGAAPRPLHRPNSCSTVGQSVMEKRSSFVRALARARSA